MKVSTIRTILKNNPAIRVAGLETLLSIPATTLSHIKHGSRKTLKKEYAEKLHKYFVNHGFISK